MGAPIESSNDDATNSLPFIYDVIIVGAGPCGLAVAARLREHTPSALFTDEEHHRYHWINKHSSQASIKNSKTGQIRRGCNTSASAVKATDPSSHDAAAAANNPDDGPSMLVLDGTAPAWLAKWKRLFQQLEISHLRSPMFFHPDPQERDGLLTFAHARGREKECQEIVGCVGKELSKHQMKKKRKARRAAHEQAKPPVTIDERDRKDYFTPPSDLFEEYCDWIADRYNLCVPGLIRQANVAAIDYDTIPQFSPHEKLFTIQTASGGANSPATTFYARTVVLAVGAGSAPSIPKPFPAAGCPAACHAFQDCDQLLQARLKKRLPTYVLVVGGGLTSAQIADRAIRQGATKVWHVMRGPMKVKPFDVDLSWMGKFRNHEKASFWSADTDEERAELVKSARGGGSITPRYAKRIHAHRASGRLVLHTYTTIVSHSYDASTGTHSIVTEPPLCPVADSPSDSDDIASGPEMKTAAAAATSENGPPPGGFHFIYFATGVAGDVSTLPYLNTLPTSHSPSPGTQLQPFIKKYPLPTYDGLPALTDDLMWTADVPLFMTGRLAALRLGPGAGNLEGARMGAERVVWGLEEWLSEKDETSQARKGKKEAGRKDSGVSMASNGDDEKETGTTADDGFLYRVGAGSRFRALAVE